MVLISYFSIICFVNMNKMYFKLIVIMLLISYSNMETTSDSVCFSSQYCAYYFNNISEFSDNFYSQFRERLWQRDQLNPRLPHMPPQPKKYQYVRFQTLSIQFMSVAVVVRKKGAGRRRICMLSVAAIDYKNIENHRKNVFSNQLWFTDMFHQNPAIYITEYSKNVVLLWYHYEI